MDDGEFKFVLDLILNEDNNSIAVALMERMKLLSIAANEFDTSPSTQKANIVRGLQVGHP